MANRLQTIFQGLNHAIKGNWSTTTQNDIIPMSNEPSLNPQQSQEILFKTNNREEYLSKSLEMGQQALLSYQWRKANTDMFQDQYAGLNNMQLMYRDVDLMDGFPEIGAALDIISEEVCCLSDDGTLISVKSSSGRVKSILEELFNNRLDVHIMLPMITRGMCKYGNQFFLLNVSADHGILGWRQLPVYDMERYDNGMKNPYISASTTYNGKQIDPDETIFVWKGKNDITPYRNWQVAHFRLLSDSIYLPYGQSYLQKIRRHWRMLSLMEDMMLIYRLDRSIERRVFKIFVGNIDDQDVPAFINDIANNFKRTPIVDPLTGQIDLRKSFLDVSQDIFIPVRNENAATPIDTLPAAQNLTAMDDIKYVQNKVLTGLKMPKAFLNFEEPAGGGNNLSLLDIRFAKTIVRIQQALLMELTKVAMIHLYLLGFKDDLMNFTLTMHNPSAQAEMLEIENFNKKIDTIKNAVSDSGNGIPIMSWTRALKQILKWSDSDIEKNLEEIRLEKALSGELLKTWDIIKRTNIFDPVDKIYGEPNAEYTDTPPGQEGDMGSTANGGGGFGGGMSSMGEDLDLGGEGDATGETDNIDLDTAANDEFGGGEDMSNTAQDNNQPMESVSKNPKGIIKETRPSKTSAFDIYKNKISGNPNLGETKIKRSGIIDEALIVNEEINSMIKDLSKYDLNEQ